MFVFPLSGSAPSDSRSARFGMPPPAVRGAGVGGIRAERDEQWGGEKGRHAVFVSLNRGGGPGRLSLHNPQRPPSRAGARTRGP